MRQDTFSVGVAFAAEDFIPIHGEAVIQVLRFTGRLFHKGRHGSLELLDLPGMRFEIRMEANDAAVGHAQRLRGRGEIGQSIPESLYGFGCSSLSRICCSMRVAPRKSIILRVSSGSG